MAALCAVGGAAAPAAIAGTRIGADAIVVEGAGGSVVVDRSPLRLTFRDRGGRVVLRQAEGAGPQPYAGVHPEPGGTQNVREPSLYAPFVFTVGAQQPVQDPGSAAHLGNMLTGAEGGVQHSATEVVDAREEGGGARLEVATTDPTGRRLVVTITPDRRLLRVSVRPVQPAGVANMGDTFESGPDEAFHGFGGRHNSLDQRGNDFYTWLEEENYSGGPFQPLLNAAPGTGGETYLFPNGPTAAYYPQPLFVSSRPYGFLIDRVELSRLRMASDRPDAWQFGVAAAELDYAVAPGEAAEAMGAVTEVTGRHREPPEWALGPQTSDNITAQELRDPPLYERKVRESIAQIDKHGTPFTAFGIEGWFLLPPETVKDLIGELDRRGMRSLLYFTPFLNPTTDREAFEKGYSVKTRAGTPYLYGSVFGVLSIVDFTNPEAVEWWQDRIKRALDLGASGFMQDWGEQVLLEMQFHNGESGATMHNRYPLLYHGATREAVEEYEREHGREIFFFTRSGYAGSAGLESGNFPGDETADWSRSNGIKALASDMLNRGIGGAFGFSTDVGGYLDSYGPLTEELWTRWLQWATLSPMLRFHGPVGSGTRHPWVWGDDGIALYKRYADLRRRVQPLIADLWREAARTGVPIARPMWLHAPGDAEAAKRDQQWMLGDDVLVAPVVDEGATERAVWFPEGRWVHPETGERFTGPGEAKVAAPLDRLPYFFREGERPFTEPPSEVGLPTVTRCTSRRRFAIRLRDPRGDRLRSARVRVAGRAVKVRRRGGRLVAVVDLRGLARGRYAVKVVGVGRSGRRYSETRRYRTCGGPRRVTTPKRPRRTT